MGREGRYLYLYRVEAVCNDCISLSGASKTLNSLGLGIYQTIGISTFVIRSNFGLSLSCVIDGIYTTPPLLGFIHLLS